MVVCLNVLYFELDSGFSVTNFAKSLGEIILLIMYHKHLKVGQIIFFSLLNVSMLKIMCLT